MPHAHHEDRVDTVMSGVLHVGVGEEFDDAKLEAYPPGAVTAVGPISLDYVDPEDDPRQK
jgi:hypothetical protein